MISIASLPQPFNSILLKVEPEIVDTISEDAWDGRILPLLFEFERGVGLSRQLFSCDGQIVEVVGDVDKFTRYVLAYKVAEHDRALSCGQLIFFDECTDLSVLRRLKEYPDETPRQQLESYWSAYCEQVNTLILVNPSNK